MWELVSLCSRAQGSHLLKPACPGVCVPQQEKPLQWEACSLQLVSNPHSLQLEKSPCSYTDSAWPEINKQRAKNIKEKQKTSHEKKDLITLDKRWHRDIKKGRKGEKYHIDKALSVKRKCKYKWWAFLPCK